jgi:hypothetical protein
VYREQFRLVAEGAGWLNDLGLFCDVVVVPSAQWLAADATLVTNPRLTPGSTGRIVVQLRNVGTSTWRRDGPNAFRLGTDEPRDRGSPLYDPRSWLSPNRIAMVESEVAPGGLATFNVTIVAPTAEGGYRETFAPVVDGVTWLSAPVTVTIEVKRG